MSCFKCKEGETSSEQNCSNQQGAAGTVPPSQTGSRAAGAPRAASALGSVHLSGGGDEQRPRSQPMGGDS